VYRCTSDTHLQWTTCLTLPIYPVMEPECCISKQDIEDRTLVAEPQAPSPPSSAINSSGAGKSSASLSASRPPSLDVKAKTHAMHSQNSPTFKKLAVNPAEKATAQLEVAFSDAFAKFMVPREPQNAPDTWSTPVDGVSSCEKDRVERLRNEVRTILVLACLLSVVIAVFLCGYYAVFLPAPGFNTVILKYISSQLGNLAPNAALVAADPSSLTSKSMPSPPAAPLWITTLWFAALVLSLGAASVALAVNQWLSA